MPNLTMSQRFLQRWATDVCEIWYRDSDNHFKLLHYEDGFAWIRSGYIVYDDIKRPSDVGIYYDYNIPDNCIEPEFEQFRNEGFQCIASAFPMRDENDDENEFKEIL